MMHAMPRFPASIMVVATRLRQASLWLLVVGAQLLDAGSWVAAQAIPGVQHLPRLTLAGVELAPVAIDPTQMAFSVTVDLQSDVPLASYVTARPRGSPALQRTKTGAWVVWDEHAESLIDNGFPPAHGRMNFAVTAAAFPGQSFPVTVWVAYRTPAGLKFGIFTVVPKP
jgi:hypothetical protein